MWPNKRKELSQIQAEYTLQNRLRQLAEKNAASSEPFPNTIKLGQSTKDCTKTYHGTFLGSDLRVCRCLDDANDYDPYYALFLDAVIKCDKKPDCYQRD